MILLQPAAIQSHTPGLVSSYIRHPSVAARTIFGSQFLMVFLGRMLPHMMQHILDVIESSAYKRPKS